MSKKTTKTSTKTSTPKTVVITKSGNGSAKAVASLFSTSPTLHLAAENRDLKARRKHTDATLKAVDGMAGKTQDRIIKMLDALDALTDQIEEGTLSPSVTANRLRKITRGYGEDSAQDLDEIIMKVQDALYYGNTLNG